MTVREIEEIESGLKILSYECDELLNSKFYGNNLFDLYFLYSGFISNIKRASASFPNLKQTLHKFPKLSQPALVVFTPLIVYSTAIFFATSFSSLMIFLIVVGLLLSFAYFKFKSKVKGDLLKVISLCAELRLQLHQVKTMNLKGEL